MKDLQIKEIDFKICKMERLNFKSEEKGGKISKLTNLGSLVRIHCTEISVAQFDQRGGQF